MDSSGVKRGVLRLFRYSLRKMAAHWRLSNGQNHNTAMRPPYAKFHRDSVRQGQWPMRHNGVQFVNGPTQEPRVVPNVSESRLQVCVCACSPHRRIETCATIASIT